MSGDDFNWAEDNSNVVLRAYGSIAVHENVYGDVVVRQERDALEDEDRFVAIPVQDAELIAQAIIDKAAEIKKGWGSDDDRPPPVQQQPEPEQQTRLALPAPQPRPTATKPRQETRHE
jgi:hypothetical protein